MRVSLSGVSDSFKQSRLARWYGGFAGFLRRRPGVGRSLFAIFFGLLTALAFPPYGAYPILWLTLPALIFLLQGTPNAWQAFITGWCFSFGLFLLGLYWIADAMFVDIGQFWWAVPFAVAGLPAFLALYYGCAAALARRIGLDGLSGSIGFALLWFLAEYARGHLLTGFPWDLVGYAWARALPILQSTSVIGIYGLTLVTLVFAALPATLVNGQKHCRATVFGSLVLLIFATGWGLARLFHASSDVIPDVDLRLVQPDVTQAEKWQHGHLEANFRHLLDLSSAPGIKPTSYVIWPETAATFYLVEDAAHRDLLAAHAPEKGAILTGVIRRAMGPGGAVRYYNSLLAIDHSGAIAATYDKSHLVPYGEYMPFRSLLPLHAIASLGLDFGRGDGLHSVSAAGLPAFSPLICYEAIFSGEVADRADRPQFLVNVTNDGWYGETPGPHQHFAMARVRAIEEGLPLARAANTGISAIIDGYGRITARLDLGKSGFIDGALPAALPPTFFDREGEWPLWLLFALLAATVIIARYRGKTG